MPRNTLPWGRPGPSPGPPPHRQCNCRCPLHYRQARLAYNETGCACTITCTTQPITLLADRWDCALFLDQNGDLWYVPALPNGTWAWENAGEIDSRHELYDASVTIAHLLRASANILANTLL
jgi:hypothetical protein